MGDLLGHGAAKGSKRAADAQLEGTYAGIHAQKNALKKIRADLAPFRGAGVKQLQGLENLVLDPNAQLDFIQNNPFFNALAGDATNRLMNIQAASGRLGTGDTPAALQNQLLLLGNDLLQQSIGNRFNIATMGQNAAAQTGAMTQNSANSISNLITGGANAQAAGHVGAANARAAGTNNLINAGAGAGLGAMGAFGSSVGAGAGSLIGLLLSDSRFKTDVEVLGRLDCGIPVCSFRYIFNPQKMIGVMAQDVEKVIPGAVLDVFDVKYVDYAELERVLNG